jgi:hypothetical protein
MTFGGDGGFDAVDPDDSANAYEGLDGGGINVTSDGGKTWNDITPPSDNYQFTNPFVMDPNNPAHLMTAGSKVWETTNAPTADWTQVFDLGTAPSGAARQMSALDVRGAPAGAALPSGPATRDFSYTGGGGTIPGLGSGAPKTFDDHPFKIGANDGDAKLTVRISWADSGSDWDLELLRKEGSNLVQVQSSAQGGTTSEQVVVPDPKPGDYVIRVDNYQASGTFKGTAKFAQRPAGAGASAPAAYVAFCGYCEPLVSRPFTNGIATNVGGSKPGKELTSDGWHFAKAKGLPLRYITSVQIDPSNPRTVYVTVAGYSRRWLPVGVLGEIDPAKVGHGHVFKSTDAGNTFTDISGNLPDIPADWTVVRNGQLVVGTDVGVFIARGTSGGTYQVLGKGLPTAPVFTMELKPKATTAEPDKLVVATQGRGVWTYTFKDPAKKKKR